ncbi:MAG: site-specific DNA-methyltransferase [Planctomycetes bacterium]|nr:site-specific DNA-methyltransferase [Planctomycetota bacterium]
MAGLTFKGKSFVQNHHLLVKYHQLIPRKDKSLTDKVSLRDNLIIHGDNLKALKALLPMYGGKVKCIYIDPPYNTGNENWVYNDNVNSPMMQDWLGKVVDREDLTRHDKWLCMMMPRLKLLRELLTDDGAIFVSIDDNEVHRLRALLDEIFTEENFVEQFIWKKSYGGGAKEKYVVRQHEYCLMYARDKQRLPELWLPPDEAAESRYYKYRDAKFETRGPYRIKPLEATKSMDRRENLVFPIKGPDGTEIMPRGQWWWSRDRVEKAIEDDEIVFTKTDGGYSVSYKQYLLDEKGKKRGAKPFSVIDKLYTQEGTADVRAVFEDQVVLQFPKPVDLIKRFVHLVTQGNGSGIVLDSTAGSGTTGQAVLTLNQEDAGQRRFILIECEDYADTITAERMRRVIRGVHDAKDERLRVSLAGTFSYFDLGPAIEMESLLSGENLPTYGELARYVFYTATGEEFDETAVDEERHFIGESKQHLVYLFYAPDLEYLKQTALTLDRAKALGAYQGKRRLVFAPTKYLDQEYLDEMRIDFAQLPFEIYQLVR